jgi:hypothetical protein
MGTKHKEHQLAAPGNAQLLLHLNTQLYVRWAPVRSRKLAVPMRPAFGPTAWLQKVRQRWQQPSTLSCHLYIDAENEVLVHRL